MITTRKKNRPVKFKILMFQLLGVDFLFSGGCSLNIPLAAGYLKAMAFKEGLLNEADIEIFDFDKHDMLGSAGLIDLIISKAPDAIGFSLYSFNSAQSLFIAGEVKKKMPGVKVIVGGPEVTEETGYILNNPVVDVGCIGQGEITFTEIIRAMLKGREDYPDIKGVFYNKSGKVSIAPGQKKIITNLDQIPSPYGLGFINLKNYGFACIETYRGCYFKCAYCAYGKPFGNFSADRIYNDINVISKNSIKRIYFVDSNFIFSPVFREICGKIKEINSDKQIEFYADVSAEHLDIEKVTLLKECNFKGVEVGLQSIHDKALKNVNRPPLDAKRFLNGIKLLKDSNIAYAVGIIIGLPNDTFEDFKQTAKFLKDNEINSVLVQLLQAFPGTKLKKEAKKYGIEYQARPPYLMIKSPYISGGEIKKAIGLYRRGPNRLNIGNAFISYNSTVFPRPKRKRDPGINTSGGCINKVIVELDDTRQTVDKLSAAGKKLSRSAGQPFTVWFRTEDPGKDIELIKSFLLPIAGSNPFLAWNIILETDSYPLVEVIKNIRKLVSPAESPASDSRQMIDMVSISIVFRRKNGKIKKRPLRYLSGIALFYTASEISESYNWKRKFIYLCKDRYTGGILIDFKEDSGLSFIREALEFIIKTSKRYNKNIFYSNLAVDCLARNMALKEKFIPGSIVKPGPFSCITLDKKLKASLFSVDRESVIDIIALQAE